MNKARGFSMVELLIALAILSIAAAIAIPSYQEHIAKVRRGDAQAALMSLANAMERYRTSNIGTDVLGYTGATIDPTDTDRIHPDKAPLDSNPKTYQLAITNLTATGYRLTATPLSSGPQKGDDCGTFRLDSDGTRSLSGASKSLDYCWR